MPTIQLRADLSTEDLIRAVDQLPPSELDDFVQRVLSLRARRQTRALDATEASLLQRINQAFPREKHDRYHELIKLRDARTLTPEQSRELLELTDQVELAEADRVEALGKLAQLRKVSLDQLLHDLGIRPAPHV
jgi:hypothetical protein